MKRKIIYIIMALLTFMLLFPVSFPTVAENLTYYAKITSNGVYLQKTTDENSPMFELPYSYFVKYECSTGDFYKVSYNNISGYVKKSDVTLMNGSPSYPYAKATFNVFVPYSLYSSPEQTSEIVCSLTTEDILQYNGKIDGQQVTSQSKIWYCASIMKGSVTYCGYIFSGVTDNLSTISKNEEFFDIVNETELKSEPQSPEEFLSTGTKVILIVAIAVPSIFIIIFLIAPNKIQIVKTKHKLKKDKKIIRHKDYFEFDESDL